MRFSGTFILLTAMLAATAVRANLLHNGSFEEQATDNPKRAIYWTMNDPDDHGDSWGSASREDWRAIDGACIATVRGTWAEAEDYGGWWQEAAASAGKTYKLSAWFWADGDWFAEVQEMKLEFWNEDRSQMLSDSVNGLNVLTSEWREETLQAVAPEGTAWVRAVFNVNKAGNAGALQIDNVILTAIEE
ncbi:MAG: hypothetical protein KJ626_14895 [Verrucomicrobia bacterium]|nr:hypothetical protein [Verrucomicrobiota bacterium]